jgi:thiosulfate sulfurtransferase
MNMFESKREPLRFCFSFSDPASLIVVPAVKTFGHDYKVDIDFIPLPDYDQSGVFSPDPAIRNYRVTDLARLAKHENRKLNYRPEPASTLGACRIKHLADEKMLGLKAIFLLLSHRWINGGDISDPVAVAAALAFLDLGPEVADAFTGEGYDPLVNADQAKAKEDGVIGVPFFTFRGESFYGLDRVAWLGEALRADPALKINHDAGYTPIAPAQLQEMIEKEEAALILDLRIPKEFGAGHIKGANCVPVKILHRTLDRLDRKWRIILVDDDGVTASEAAKYLAGEGFERVHTLIGGFPAWRGGLATGLDNWQDKLIPRPKPDPGGKSNGFF